MSMVSNCADDNGSFTAFKISTGLCLISKRETLIEEINELDHVSINSIIRVIPIQNDILYINNYIMKIPNKNVYVYDISEKVAEAYIDYTVKNNYYMRDDDLDALFMAHPFIHHSQAYANWRNEIIERDIEDQKYGKYEQQHRYP